MIQKIASIQNTKNRKFIDLLLIIVGTFFMASPVKVIYDPMKLAMGGFGGLAVVLKHVAQGFNVDLPIWLTNALLNIPVFLIALIILGKKFVAKTLFGAVAFGVWLYIVPTYDLCGGDYLLAIVFGGVLDGIGIGLVFLTNSTTGGTDMVSAILHKFIRHYSVPNILFVVDGIIILLGAYAFGIRNAMYGSLTIYILTKISDAMLEGVKFAKMVYIISGKYEEIADKIMHDLDRGVTSLRARGMYTRSDKNMLFCVVNKKEIITITEIAAATDPNSFIIVSDVREVFGEGFITYKNSEVK